MKKETAEDVMEFFHSVPPRSPTDPALTSGKERWHFCDAFAAW